MSKGAEIPMESNTWAAAEEMPQSDVGGQPLGKILSLDRREAKKVLEIYVKRSLSCHENSVVAKKTFLEKDRGRGRKKSPEDQKENTAQKAKEKDVKAPQGSKPEGAKKHRVDSSTSPTPGRALKKKPSLKKVFSMKKHGEEERGEPGSGARSKRPGCLPLRHVLTPAQPGGTPKTLTHPCWAALGKATLFSAGF
ncbi:hypothetical protein IHE44_0008346 [Lamprotornis superbus]|uniref:Uncharacterized protein n=1 Tax=Lamprotornis superbus TaxID=245042 RepID=A0A835TRQ8_9PASS|nr:hypothetical protein IHE44_0008346 [Lamprotornis superbus]